MEEQRNEYHISFFRPTTPQAKFNRNLVIILVLIWTIAIFGFQVLLRVLQKPTPEAAFNTFIEVRYPVLNGTASTFQLQQFSDAILSVLGKVFIEPGHREVLDNAFSWSVYQLIPEDQKEAFVIELQNFERIKEEITDITDPVYIRARDELSGRISPLLGLPDEDVRTKFIPLELVSADLQVFREDNMLKMAHIMKKYLTHNQSFLTDFKFLGFPFHYFYTAVFLLVLFVFLCWLYCVSNDRLNKKLNIVE